MFNANIVNCDAAVLSHAKWAKMQNFQNSPVGFFNGAESFFRDSTGGGFINGHESLCAFNSSKSFEISFLTSSVSGAS